MKLALIQDVSTVPPGHQELSLPRGTLGGGKQTDMLEQTRFVQVQEGELEDVMFTILQPSFEDAQGVLMIQNIKRSPQQVPVSLLSARTFNALMMLDFWNPVYSWRRAVLMQYVPKMTVYDEATHRYDLEDAFIANVKESKFYVESDPEIRRTSPEYQFISLLDIELEDYQARIQNYMNSVQARLQTIDGLVDYITLAESRRRIYRPLPLDEFALTLPYALKYGLDLNIRYEMTETGEIEKMPARGAAFFQAWTGTDSGGSLSGYDPHIIPQPDAPPNNALSRGGSFAISTSAPAKPTHIVARRCPYRKAPTEELYGM